MDESPLVSVIVPVFNTGNDCLKLLERLLKSTYKNLEIICIDDGSKDDSYKILCDFAKKHKKVVVKTQKNAGPSAARNTGLKYATGEYVSFIDSDDLVAVDYIEKLLKEYQNKKTILASSALKYKRLRGGSEHDDYIRPVRARNKNESLKEYVLYLMCLDGRIYSAVTKLFRRDIIAKNHLVFDTTMDFAEDTKFVLDYISASIPDYPDDCEIHFVYEPLYIYNYGTSTSTVAKSSLKWQNWQKSYNYLKKWSDGHGVRIKFRRNTVLTRWRISHMLAVGRSDISNDEKKKYANSFGIILAKLLLKFRK